MSLFLSRNAAVLGVLYAANGTIIPTYRQKLLQLDFAFSDSHL